MSHLYPAARRAGSFGGRMLQRGCATTRSRPRFAGTRELLRSPRAATAPQQHVRAASSAVGTGLTPVEIIAKKREGEELSAAEVHAFIQQFTAGEVADYQMAAWLMAVCLRGMTPRETAELTLAMVQSGSVADLSDIPGAKSGAPHPPLVRETTQRGREAERQSGREAESCAGAES